MNDQAKKYLYDIKDSIGSIYIHLNGIDDFDRFTQNLTIKRAIERELEIIGEAMNLLLIADPSIRISDSRKIIAMRNRIIHGYDSVDDTVIWNVIISNLSILKSEVEALLNQ
jgi:uncharacterized protein with HEPN domain